MSVKIQHELVIQKADFERLYQEVRILMYGEKARRVSIFKKRTMCSEALLRKLRAGVEAESLMRVTEDELTLIQHTLLFGISELEDQFSYSELFLQRIWKCEKSNKNGAWQMPRYHRTVYFSIVKDLGRAAKRDFIRLIRGRKRIGWLEKYRFLENMENESDKRDD